MYLKAKEIQSENIIHNAKADYFKDVACDLRIEHILTEGREHEAYNLGPMETVYVSTEEDLYMPNDCLGRIIIKNSAIRMGLDVAAPVYRPGHKTKVFVRVTNLSGNVVKMSRGESIFSCMIYRLDGAVPDPYQGAYTDEFKFSGIGTHDIKIPYVEKIESKIKDIEAVEKHIYGNVMLMLTIFVAMFSLVNLNVNVLQAVHSLNELLSFNFVFIAAISILVMLVAHVIDKDRTMCKCLAWLPVAAIALAAVFWVIK